MQGLCAFCIAMASTAVGCLSVFVGFYWTRTDVDACIGVADVMIGELLGAALVAVLLSCLFYFVSWKLYFAVVLVLDVSVSAGFGMACLGHPEHSVFAITTVFLGFLTVAATTIAMASVMVCVTMVLTVLTNLCHLYLNDTDQLPVLPVHDAAAAGTAVTLVKGHLVENPDGEYRVCYALQSSCKAAASV